MKNTLRLTGTLVLLSVTLIMPTACTPKQSDTAVAANVEASLDAVQPEAQTESTITENAGISGNANPLTLAQRAFDLIMQLEGKDDHDPAVVEAMSRLEETVEELPQADQWLYYRKIQQLYIGEPLYVNTVEFNNEKIPITVFCTFDPDFWLNAYIDGLEFIYDGARQIVRIEGGEEMMPINDNDPNNFDRVSVGDYNFDGFMDIAVFMQTGFGSNEQYAIYLYNPQTKSYHRHEELSGMWGVSTDTGMKTIKTFAKTGAAGYTTGEYKWNNGQLTQIRREDMDYDDELEKYIRITQTLENGVWVEKTEMLNEEDL